MPTSLMNFSTLHGNINCNGTRLYLKRTCRIANSKLHKKISYWNHGPGRNKAEITRLINYRKKKPHRTISDMKKGDAS
jgi:hypothetical protein